MFYINKAWLYSINIFFKNEVFFSNSTLIENSATDNKNSFVFLNRFNLFSENRLLLFYIYYITNLKSKLVIYTTCNTTNTTTSIDKLYKSASWLERETGEMFKVQFLGKTDTRRLLLDYSKQENPLLKDFPSEGFNDTSFNFFEDQVVYN